MDAMVFFVYRFFLFPLVYQLLMGIHTIIVQFLSFKKSSNTGPTNGNDNFEKNNLGFKGKIFCWWLKQKIYQMILDRQNQNWIPLPSSPVIIHASSGEIEYAKPLIRDFKKKYPQCPILVTYSSPSAKKLFKDLTEVDLFLALPWDHHRIIKKFLDFYQPKMILYARTDVWPELSFQARKKNIPQILFAATFAKNSSRLKGLSLLLNRWSLHQLNEIHCVDDADLIQLKLANINTETLVQGDTRFDQVFFRLSNNPYESFPKMFEKNKTFIWGSTWPEDEVVLFDFLKKKSNHWKYIIWAPHEINLDHMSKIKKQLDELNISWVLWSDVCGISKDAPILQNESESKIEWDIKNLSKIHNAGVLLIDRIGVLAFLYQHANLAFVGGSFKEKVHSVMEALASGCYVITGPKIENNREALHFKNVFMTPANIPAVQIANQSNDFFEIAESFPLDPQISSSLSLNLIHKVKSQQGATEKALSWVYNQMK